MKLLTVGITGLGACVPDRVLTNADLEAMVDTTDEWIRTRTGIRERRICTEAEATSDLALKAAQQALASAGVKPEELDLIVHATMTPDRLWPSTGSTVQGRLGAVNAGAFDVNAACSGFIYALAVGAQMVRTGLYRKVLVIGADVVTKFLDYTDRQICVLFGDGAGAVLLEPVPEQDEGLISFFLGSDGTRSQVMYIPAGGSRIPPSHHALDEKLNFPVMDGFETFQFATWAMMDSIQKALAHSPYQIQDVNLIVPHQANIRIIQTAARWLSVPMEKFSVTIDRYGNTVAASIPLSLYDEVRAGRLQRGDLVALTSFGAGLTWASALLRWTI
ncbi:MAG: beta-ketoacyl-ACP synthase III [Acidobacteriota bacterium]|nr:ketoacyl-ACP synthase III [Blastocatellia bacterium]MDW8239724.1 beta-ketoacyl-ACP synthase III [Acidobacteriota bacterium]